MERTRTGVVGTWLAFGLLAAVGSGCGGDECTPEEDHCEGNTRFVCEMSGSHLAWSKTDCGGQTCVAAKCVSNPEPCQPVPETVSFCDTMSRSKPGVCDSASGYIDWKAPCASGGEVCLEVGEGSVARPKRALCVLMPESTCSVGAPDQCFKNDAYGEFVGVCDPSGYYVFRAACGDARVCANGLCVKR